MYTREIKNSPTTGDVTLEDAHAAARIAKESGVLSALLGDEMMLNQHEAWKGVDFILEEVRELRTKLREGMPAHERARIEERIKILSKVATYLPSSVATLENFARRLDELQDAKRADAVDK